MIKFALLPIVLLAALVPLCSGTIWGYALLLLIATGILFGTLSLGSSPESKSEEMLNK